MTTITGPYPAIANQTLLLMNNASKHRNETSPRPMESILSLNYNLPVMVIVAILLLTIVVAMIFGNFLVGLALFKYRSLRTISHYLIANLALSDFLLATSILPLSTVNECLGYWVFGSAMCYFWLSIDVFYCTASIWNLCVIAFDRFTATLYPIWYHEKRSWKHAATYVSCVWAIAIAICLPLLVGRNDLSQMYVYDNVTDVHYCILYQSPAYVLYSASCSFYIPFFITVVLYVRIFTVLYRRMKQMRQKTKQRVVVNSVVNHTKTNNLEKPELPVAMTMITANAELGNMEETSSKSFFGSDSVSVENQIETGNRKKEIFYITGNETSLLELKNYNASYMSSSDTKTVSYVTTNGAQPQQTHGNTISTVLSNPDHVYDPKTVQMKAATNVIQCATNNDSATTNATQLMGVSNETCAKSHKSFAGILKSVNLFKVHKTKQLSATGRRRLDQREVRATIRMAVIIACFCGCWLGFFIIYVLNSWVNGLTISRQLDAFFFWLAYSNSAMNPVLYAILNEDFRKAFQKILGCHRRR
ncbi:Octopamine receptor 2 [Lamellibrachia satsuma]|nr:Octopamine receptor 2 [Lamellibrachia satsuma]